MRHIQRSTTVVLLILVLAMPAAAASRRSSRSTGIVQAMQRFVILVTSRISPPGSAPVLAPRESTVNTTSTPTKTQQP
jgi:hypothetical protein